jgi:hypothetical protein
MVGMNKILIIANSRSGSKNTMVSLHKVTGIRFRAEPWNYTHEWKDRDYSISEDRIIIKTLADQIPEGREFNEFYDELIPKFDLVILLSRKNRDDVYESFNYFASNNIDWHTEWERPEGMVVSDEVMGVVDNQYVCLKEIHNKYNLPFTWYEDLYSGDYEIFKEVTKDWGIDSKELFSYFNPNNRLRKLK